MNNRFKMFVNIIILCGLLLACKMPVPILPEYIKKITVTTFSNNTIQYGIEEKLVKKVTEEFLRDGQLEVVQRKDQADALLLGEVSQYTLEPISYDIHDVVEEYKLWITVDFRMKDLTTGQVLWEENDMEADTTYFVTSDAGRLVETQEEAQERVIEDLAKDIVQRTVYGW